MAVTRVDIGSGGRGWWQAPCWWSKILKFNRLSSPALAVTLVQIQSLGMEKCRCKSRIWPSVPCLPVQPPAWGDKAAAISAALNVTFSHLDAWSPHHLRCLLIFLKCQRSFQTRFEFGCQARVAVLSPPAWLSHEVLSGCGCWLKCWGEGN